MGIRQFTASDLPSIFDIYAHAKLDEFQFEERQFELVPLDQDAERLHQFESCDVIVYEENSVVGFAATSGAALKALFVHPKARGRGVGRQLLERVLSQIEGEISLNVAKSNLPARRLYESYGFAAVKEFETEYNGVKVLYQTLATRYQQERNSVLS